MAPRLTPAEPCSPTGRARAAAGRRLGERRVASPAHRSPPCLVTFRVVFRASVRWLGLPARVEGGRARVHFRARVVFRAISESFPSHFPFSESKDKIPGDESRDPRAPPEASQHPCNPWSAPAPIRDPHLDLPRRRRRRRTAPLQPPMTTHICKPPAAAAGQWPEATSRTAACCV